MALKEKIPSHPWISYSKMLVAKIDKPHCVGRFSQEEAQLRQMRAVDGRAGSLEQGEAVFFSLLVDPTDGQIVDARFQVYGPSFLIALAETSCEFLVGMHYIQAKRIHGELIEKKLRDQKDVPAFSEEFNDSLSTILRAIEAAVEHCADLPLPDHYETPMSSEMSQPGGDSTGYPGWIALPDEKKIAAIEEVLDKEVRPYVALDGGGLEVLKLIDAKELIISYQGNCTSCYSSVGTTLTTIQQILRAQIHPDLIVVPHLE